MDQKNKLPASIEKLLIKTADGEGFLLERLLGSVLVAVSSECRNFKDEMSSVSLRVRSLREESGLNAKPVDLWSRIERRIDEEERAAVYLGDRPVAHEERTSLGSWMREVFSPALFGGMAVGVATATIAFFAFKPGDIRSSSVISGAQFSSNRIVSEQPPVDLVSFSTAKGGSSRPKVDNREAFRNQRQVRLLKRMDTQIPFEVDWMKSDGKVSFIQDPSQGSTVIWVKRDEARTASKALSLQPGIVDSAR